LRSGAGIKNGKEKRKKKEKESEELQQWKR
jgi:hypothetical protein